MMNLIKISVEVFSNLLYISWMDICIVCKKHYFNKAKYDFSLKICSNNCRTKHRRDCKVDHVEKTCLVCCKKFTSNKANKTHHCSRECGRLTAASIRRLKNKI